LDKFLFLNVDLDVVQKFDCYPGGWSPDGVLKKLEVYAVFNSYFWFSNCDNYILSVGFMI